MTDVAIDVDETVWDRNLAELGGHPWQSAYWGRAVGTAQGVADPRLMAMDGRRVVQMARVERRVIRGIGPVGWIRRGPVGATETHNQLPLVEPIARKLADEGYGFIVASPWQQAPEVLVGSDNSNCPMTFWVDLSKGETAVRAGLTKKFRSGINRAVREGVEVAPTSDPADLDAFYALCQGLSETKGFSLALTRDLLTCLVNGCHSGSVEAKLFAAKVDGELAAGALVARSGRSIHYLDGATHRAFSAKRPSEVMHWSVMTWAMAQGCTRYELEGVDPVGNPGVYAFKKRFGGEEIHLLPRQVQALTPFGRAIAPVARHLLSRPSNGLQSLARTVFAR